MRALGPDNIDWEEYGAKDPGTRTESRLALDFVSKLQHVGQPQDVLRRSRHPVLWGCVDGTCYERRHTV
jgi:hypothetical protein